MKNSPFNSARLRRGIYAVLLSCALSACSSLGAPGPSASAVRNAGGERYAEGEIVVIDLDDRTVQQVVSYGNSQSFAQVFGDSAPTSTLIGQGDVLDIAIWEAPPAVLFGATLGAEAGGNPLTSQRAAIPQQMVGDSGTVTVPFIGQIEVAGRTTSQVEHDIVSKLVGKAHQPQAVVRLVQNEARNVTVIGEVGASRRVPLSARGERVLDVLAAAGGPRQPVGKTTVQLARGTDAAIMSLDTIIRDPAQNIRLRPDDIISVMFQPYSFIALGAVSQNAEVPFEGGGLTLAQALGRIGGLRADLANIRGVFIFRMEDPAALDAGYSSSSARIADGRVPVVYRVDMSDASSLFVAQNFVIRDDDVIYVSTAPGVDFQRFLSTISSVAFSTVAIGDAIQR